MIRSLKIRKSLSLILSFCLVLSAFFVCADGIFAKAEAMSDDGLGRVNLAGLIPSELKSVNYNGSGTCPYVSGDRYVINDFESTANMATDFQTTITTDSSNSYEGNYSVKMNADVPAGQGGNVGAMMYIRQSGMDLSQYAYLHFNYYLSRDFDESKNSAITINLATTGSDGCNMGITLNGRKKGWHTFSVSMEKILACAVTSVDISNINTVRITWFNHCQENTPTYFEFDNMYMSQNQSVELVSGTSGHKLESSNRRYSSGVRLIPGSNNTVTVTYNVKNMGICGFSGIFCKDIYAYNYGSDVSAEIFADGSSVGYVSGINAYSTDKFVCSIPQTAQTVQIKVTWNGGDAIPVDICDGAFLYTVNSNNENAVYLSDMQEEYFASLNNICYRDSNSAGKTISIEGQTFEKGLSLHPMPDKPAMLSYDITDLNSNTFVSYVGQSDTAPAGGDGVRCLIYVDGQLKYDKTFMYNTPADLAVIDVTNANQLYIRLENNGNYASDAFSLGDAHFVLNGTLDAFASSYNTVDLTGREMKNVSSNGGKYHINTALENTNPLVVGYKHFNHGISMHPFSNARAYVEYPHSPRR